MKCASDIHVLKCETLAVFQPGTPVLIGLGGEKISAEVLAVAIYSHNIQYQCAWWDARSRRVEWLEDFEVEPLADKSKKTPIGFSDPQRNASPQVICRG